MNPFSSRCCQHNHGQGWPYYIEHLIMATSDNGIAAAIFGACIASAKVSDGKSVEIVEDSNYPFEESICLPLILPKKFRFLFISESRCGRKIRL